MMCPNDTREPLTEARAGYLYLVHAFKQSEEGWKGMREFLDSYERGGPELVQKIEYPSETLALAVIGQNLSALLHYSPLFQNNHDQASRLEQWTLFTLLSDFSDMIPWSPEKTLAKVRQWQQLDFQFVNQLKETDRNPFGDLTGNLLGELLGDDLLRLCQTGTTILDHFLLSVLADLFTIMCSTTFSYWKSTIEKYQLIREEMTWDT